MEIGLYPSGIWVVILPLRIEVILALSMIHENCYKLREDNKSKSTVFFKTRGNILFVSESHFKFKMQNRLVYA